MTGAQQRGAAERRWLRGPPSLRRLDASLACGSSWRRHTAARCLGPPRLSSPVEGSTRKRRRRRQPVHAQRPGWAAAARTPRGVRATVTAEGKEGKVAAPLRRMPPVLRRPEPPPPPSPAGPPPAAAAAAAQPPLAGEEEEEEEGAGGSGSHYRGGGLLLLLAHLHHHYRLQQARPLPGGGGGAPPPSRTRRCRSSATQAPGRGRAEAAVAAGGDPSQSWVA